MKRILQALALMACSASAFALTPYSILFYQADPTGTIYQGFLPTPANINQTYLMVYDGGTQQPQLVPQATVATTGSYNDLSNKPTIPSIPSRSQTAATRSLNTAFQISTTRDTLATYSVQITVTASIAGGQNGDVILEIAADSAFTTSVQTLSIAGVGQTYSLAVALQGIQPQTSVVSGYVPAGFYARLRTVQNTGTPTFSFRAGQEVSL